MQWPSPWLFVLLPLPYGVYLGYIQTPLPYLLRQSGYPVDRIGSTESLILLPMALYFLWSPIVDFGLRRRTWIVLLAAISGALLLAAILLLGEHALLATHLLCAGFAVNLMTTACAGGLLAAAGDAEVKATGAAWMQGGMLAATALGGAALLALARALPALATAIIAAVLVAVPAVVALTIPEPPAQAARGNLLRKLRSLLVEMKQTLLSRKALPGLLLLVAPVGSGAAQSLFAAMAQDYHVSERGVVLLNGLGGGILTMLGAFAAVLAPPRWDRRITYAVAGAVCACSGIFLAAAPMRPWSYFLGVGAYMLTTGTCYAFFLGVVMVTLGEPGQSASSRYTLLVSLGNLPIVYMTRVESLGYRALGPRAIPGLDALGNLLVAFLVVLWLVHAKRVLKQDQAA